MLRWVLIALLCCQFGCLSSPAGNVETISPAAAGAKAPVGAVSMALHVKGMGCPLCATNVRKSLERTPGVEAVNIDLGAGVVKVSARPNLAPEESALRKAVADAGFECSKVERL